MNSINNKTVETASDVHFELPRYRLTDIVLNASQHAAWIGAPRGLGKTVLLQQLEKALLRRFPQQRTLLLTIDEHNALNSLLQQLRNALPLAAGAANSLNDLLARLASQRNSPQKLNLLIDGLDIQQHGSLIHYLIESSHSLTGKVRLCLAIDDFIPLGSHRLFRDARLFHISLDDLRMTQAETQSLLTLYGGSSDHYDVHKLLQYSDGIPAAATMLLDNADQTATIRNRLLGDWIERNLVSYLEPMEVLRLASLSILREFNLQQASQLLGVPCAETERWLQRYTPLLFRHIQKADLFSWSQLMQPYFFHCLLDRYRDLLPNILKRSEPWLTDININDRCLEYLMQSIKKPWARDIVLSKCRSWFEQRNAASLITLVERIPAEDCLEQTELSLYYCWALILHRRINDADQWIERIESNAPRAMPLQDNILVLRTLAQVFDHPRPPYQQRATLLEQCLDKQSLFQGEVLSFYANMLHAAGDSGVSRKALQKAISFHQANHNLTHLSHARMLYWRIEFNEGATDTVKEAALLYIQELKESALHTQSIDASHAVELAVAMAQSGLADFLYEGNDLQAAKALYLESIPVLKHSEWTYTSVVAQVGLTRLLISAGDHLQAANEMDTIKQRVRDRENTSLSAVLCFETMRTLRSEGKSVLPAASEYDMNVKNLSIEFLFEDQHDKERLFWIKCYIMVLLEQKNFTSALIYSVKGLIKSLNLRDNRNRTLFTNIKALCEYKLGQKEEAIKSMNEAMQLAQKCGFLRTMINDDFGWSEVWREVDHKQAFSAQIVPSFISQIRDQLDFDATQNPHSNEFYSADTDAIDNARLESCRQLGLTEKEYEILKLLAEGLCNKKIASRSQIALTTVKWHLQNIFGKLQARNRTEAVVKAQEYALIGK